MAVIEGGASAGLADVGSLTKGIRIEQRPVDVGALGEYQMANFSGTMAAGLAGASTVYSLRWADATRAILIRRLSLVAMTLGTAFTAGQVLFELMAARTFTASDTGGTSILPVTNSQKKRTSFGTTLITDLRIASTGALTPGTRTLDGNPHNAIRAFVPATQVNYPIVGGHTIVPGASTVAFDLEWRDLYNHKGSKWPLVFVQNEGLILRATVPATGTWEFGVLLEWAEIVTTGGFN